MKLHSALLAVGLLGALGCAGRPQGGSSTAAEPPAAASAGPRPNEPLDPHEMRLRLVGKPARALRLPAASPAGGTVVVPTAEVTVLVFVGSWSHGSLRALRQLRGLHEKHAAEGLRVVAVSMDETMARAREFAEEHAGGRFPVAWSGGMTAPANDAWIAGPYGGENAVWLLDRTGRVRFVHRGGKDGCAAGDPEVEQQITELLAEPPARGRP